MRHPMFRLVAAVAVVSTMWGVAAIASQKSAATMAAAATRFVDSLSADQRTRAVLPFDSEDRLRWHFIPNEMFARKGLMIKDMTEAQRRLAHDLLKTGLSARGYTKVTSIFELEDILQVMEKGGRFARNKDEYLVAVFGVPGAKGNWGWRVEGHHVSLRFTIAEGATRGQLSSSPMFLGTNPAEVRDGARKGLRVLGDEEDAARALVSALPAELQQQALIKAVAPTDILTMNTNDITPFPDQGVLYSALPAAAQAQLVRLIEVYTSNMEADVAAARLAKITAAGLGRIRFAWAGPIERGQKHYYMIQGPTFLVEYDNTQNNGNHIHSVWRDFDGDFGRDLLREHLQAVAH